MEPLGPSEWLWKEGAGYYDEQESDLLRHPCLPNEEFIPDRRVMHLFERHGNLSARSQVLEVGCGRSPWLPYLAQTAGCQPVGLDFEPHAAQLARANLAGCGVEGDIYCRDAFDHILNEDLWRRFDLVYSLGVMEHLPEVSDKIRILSRYLKPGGRLVTLVPNMQGINWVMQRIGSLRVLQAHVVYTTASLQIVHEQAGLETVACEYLGFVNGFLSATIGESKLRRAMHYGLCRTLASCGAVWIRMGLPMQDWPWVAPFVFYVGRRPAADGKALGSKEHAVAMPMM